MESIMNAEQDSPLNQLVGRQVVLDTQGPTVILGLLVQISDEFFVLEQVDVHDRSEGHSSKELYVIHARKLGIRVNRRKSYVPRQNIVSISALDDVVAE